MNHLYPCLTRCEVFFLTQLSARNELLMADGQSVASLLRQKFVELKELGWAITESGRGALRLTPTEDRRARRDAHVPSPRTINGRTKPHK